jgi:outer membrane lipopolysaccharide assembly protein LptE/RlpB
MIKKISQYFLCGIVLLLLSSCGFQLRSAKALPVALRTLYLNNTTSNPTFTYRLKAQLQALGIHLVSSPERADITLAVGNYKFINSQPSITTSNQALMATISLQFTYQLFNAKKQPLTSKKTISVQNNQILNANQIYQPRGNTLMEYRLQQNAISMLFDELISNKIKQELAQALRQRQS